VDVSCIVAMNVFKPCAFLIFNMLYPYLINFHYFTIVNLEFERGLRDEIRALNRVKARTIYRNSNR
jgi:hypothetical protein